MKKKSIHGYLNEFIQLSSAPDMLELGLFPNVKEISESMGCFHAAIELFGGMECLGRHDIAVVVIGDGVSPRTAGLFAFRSRWDCYAIDPLMREKYKGKINRTVLYATKGEDVEIEFGDKEIVLIYPHSHASIKNTYQNFTTTGKKHIISIPCCKDNDLGNTKAIYYRDKYILSPKNEVYIWKDVK